MIRIYKLTKSIPAVLLVCFVILLSDNARLESAGKKRLTIVYTNSLNGNLDYCKCKSDPKGGLVKRSTEIKKIRKQYRNVFLFETGDFFSLEPDKLLAKYIIRAYRHIGYDGIVFGDQEFVMGSRELLKYKDQVPFLCNNIRIKNAGWGNPFKRYRIISKGGLRVGVIGTIDGSSFRYYPVSIKNSIKAGSQLQEIKKDIRALKSRGVDLIVLLSHSGYEKDKELRKKLGGIGVIVGGHSQTLLKFPDRKGNTIIVQAGTNGSRIGIMEVEVSGGKVKMIRNRFRMPDENQPEDDPYIRRLINRYNEESRKKIDKLKFN